MSAIKSVAKIIPGSNFQCTLYLVDADGRPVSLTPYSAAALVFVNAKGERTSISLTVPGANPDKGQLSVSAVATGADDKWTNADLELTASGILTVIPLNNKFEIVKRNCPAA